MKHSMKTRFLSSVAFCGLCISVSGADTITLQSGKSSVPGQIGFHSQMALPVSSMYPEYTILRSTNLVNWEPVAGPIAGSVGVSDEFLRQAIPLAGDHAFYRVVADVKLASPDTPLGDTIYGYGTEFGRQLQAVGQLPLSEFVSRYTPTNHYLSQLTFDPTSAEYFPGFGLDTNELPIFQTNGFVVSGRLGTYSFADSFYKVFSADLPVFFSCDAALHAWHRSYMGMLEEVEEVYLAPRLQVILQSMGGQVANLYSQASGTALSDGVLDADYFLAVGRSLATGTNNYGSLGQSARVLATLTAITNLQPANFNLFGANRWVDFSQFQVRGHYETSHRLGQYFRAMMWCGLIDFRFTGSTTDNSLRELAGAVAMHFLLNNSGYFSNWKRVDQVVQMFVGVPDSLNFAQLNDLMTAAGVVSPYSLPTQASLLNLQSNLMSGQLGVQQIQSGYFFSPLTRQQIKLPRSFTVLGQRFVPDAWAMGQSVFDKIIWDEDGIPGFEDKVMRRVPSALDIAFSVLGNDQTVPDIAARIASTDGLAWRDGYPYQHNLAAARRTVELQDPSVWTNNIYYYWLACLRELSAPTTGPEYPDALRTRAWGMKTLNTQLASWTELRHDTVLYVKQSYTGEIICSYPDGLIEPRVSFWERMRDMALRTKDLVSTLSTVGEMVFEPNLPYEPAFTVSIGTIYTNRINFLNNFAANMSILRGISVKELNRQALSSNEVFFIKGLIEDPNVDYTHQRTFSGWYPGLFYSTARAAHSEMYCSSDVWDALVTDVHTDPTEPLVGDPGCVLHEGVGAVQLLMVAVNWGPGDACVYAGPVMSHYEFQLGPATRRTDSEWKSQIRAGNAPPTPDWTRSYWVPGTFTFPSWIY
jgi:hypothetical protein